MTPAEMVLAVESAKVFVSDPEGDCPMCKNVLGTMRCERCGRDMTIPLDGACPASPPEQRYRIEWRGDPS